MGLSRGRRGLFSVVGERHLTSCFRRLVLEKVWAAQHSETNGRSCVVGRPSIALAQVCMKPNCSVVVSIIQVSLVILHQCSKIGVIQLHVSKESESFLRNVFSGQNIVHSYIKNCEEIR